MHRQHPHFALPPTNGLQPSQEQLEAELDLEQKMEEETCWRTNLLIESEVSRVDERNQLFKKRTSFEENLVNDHLATMKTVLEQTGLKVSLAILPSNDKQFAQSKESKQIQAIDCNAYLSEQEKWEIREVVLANQENFSILMRFTLVLEENKEELVYLLAKLIHYCSTSVQSHAHQRVKPNIHALFTTHRLKLTEFLLSQPLVKLMAPLFFSNINEQPLMEIIESWFVSILCIKNGVYEQGEEEMEEESEEDNFFD